jgi:hypothetical protein
LGDVSLAQIEQGFQVADAGFTLTDSGKDAYAGWGAKSPENAAEFFVRGQFVYIHDYEYIIRHIRKFEYDKCQVVPCGISPGFSPLQVTVLIGQPVIRQSALKSE